MFDFRRGGCVVAAIIAAMSSAWSAALPAQANVPQYRGDYGMLSGTLPPAGAYASFVFNNYQSNKVVGANGHVITGFLPANNTAGVQLMYSFPAPLILHAHWAATLFVPWTDAALETPIQPFTRSWGFGDIFVQPIKLGWSYPLADFVLGSGVYMPTGRYSTATPIDNTGLGIWGFEQQAGTTVYLGPSRRGAASVLLSYEFSSNKRDTDERPGELLTLEGGIGHSILTEVGRIGLVYYAQWKTTRDQNFHLPPELDARAHHYGLGPELTLPFPLPPFTGIVTLRYFFERDSKVAPQGDSFWVTFTLFHPHKKK